MHDSSWAAEAPSAAFCDHSANLILRHSSVPPSVRQQSVATSVPSGIQRTMTT